MQKKVLFVCVENSGRSQIAEAFFKKYAPKRFHSTSAGTNPANNLNPIVVQAMKEIGITLSQKPKPLSNEMITDSILTINMGCMDKESCPALFLKNIPDWEIPDPKGKSIDEVRKIRDHIETRIKHLIESLEEC